MKQGRRSLGNVSRGGLIVAAMAGTLVVAGSVTLPSGTVLTSPGI
jgi:hypothetical protein